MTVVIPGGYALPGSDYPLTHARIVHARNWLSGGTVAVSTTGAEYFADAPTNSLTAEKWGTAAVPATWEYNHGSAAKVDCCAILGRLSGCVVAVEYWNGSAWVEVARASVTSNAPILFIFASVTAQRWRVNILSGTNPELSVVRFAVALQMPRPFYGGHIPVDFGRQVVLRSNYTETGEFVGRTRQSVMLKTSCSWMHIPEAWVNANWPAMQRAIETEAFFIAWRPAESQMVAYAQTDEVPQPETMGLRDFYQLSLSFRAYSHD